MIQKKNLIVSYIGVNLERIIRGDVEELLLWSGRSEVSMSNKIILAKNGCKGNLQRYEQNTFVCYLQREIRGEEVLCDKIALELLAPSTNGELVVKSYYMPEPDNVKVLILDLLKGLMKLEKERGNLDSDRIALYQYQFNKAIVDIGLKARQGVYDEDQKY